MNTETSSKFAQAVTLLPEPLKAAALSIDRFQAERVRELRLRRGRRFTASLPDREYFITADGALSDSPENALTVSSADIEYTFKTAFQGSVYAFPKELSEGFITCGGNRVGFCGSAVLSDGKLTVVKEISSVNIRIASEIVGCAEELYEKAFAGGLRSLIIAAPPCGGKTTVLRDLCRILGNTRRVSLIDERGELAAASGGIPQNDVGAYTDVFNGYPRHEGIMTAVRVMSPEVIVCDEIGAPEDLKALGFAANSGAALVCTCHSPTLADLKRRPAAGELIERGIFGTAAVLGTGAAAGKVIGFYEL